MDTTSSETQRLTRWKRSRKWNVEPFFSRMQAALRDIRVYHRKFVKVADEHNIPYRTLRRYVKLSYQPDCKLFYIPNDKDTSCNQPQNMATLACFPEFEPTGPREETDLPSYHIRTMPPQLNSEESNEFDLTVDWMLKSPAFDQLCNEFITSFT